jgi:hypothetical protein
MDDIYNCDVDITLNKLNVCPGQKHCKQCFNLLKNGGHCTGCNGYNKRCLKRICAFTSCNICSGGKHSQVTGCCGRAPRAWIKKMQILLNLPVKQYSPKSLPIKCKLIPIIYAQVKKFRIPEKFPKIDAWAAPIHKLANIKGKFRSSDLKDYLGLPPNRKLILSTSAPDSFQEMLWQKGASMNFKHHGIDFWFPAHYSVYDNDSKLYQLVSAKRQQLNAINTKSQFVWFRLGEHIPIEFLEPIRNAKSVLISTSQMISNFNRNILHSEVKKADEWFRPKTSFFIHGKYQNLPINNKRTCYRIDSTWLMRGLRGHDIKRNRISKVKMEQNELLVHNLKETYEEIH